MDRETGIYEPSDLGYPPSTASGITDWKGDIFLEDEKSALEWIQRYSVQQPPGVERNLSVYDVVSGMPTS